MLRRGPLKALTIVTVTCGLTSCGLVVGAAPLNLVGTESEESQSIESGGEQGQRESSVSGHAKEVNSELPVPRPAGHQGIWFETEPSDKWERYVWKSQKYVGDPIVLPPLREREVPDNYVGKPDICSDEVRERMKDIGFEGERRLKDGKLYKCTFERPFEPSFSESSRTQSMLLFPETLDYLPAADYESRYVGGKQGIVSASEEIKVLNCGGRRDLDGSATVIVESAFKHQEDRNEHCRIVELFNQITLNVGVK